MALVYIMVALIFIAVAYACRKVWRLSCGSDPKRMLTHFAQHQVVFVACVSGFAVVLCVVTAAYQAESYGWLGRWWALFDVLIGFVLLAQLKNLELSLTAGRQG